MDLKLVDGMMSEFEKLPHDGQVELFLELKNRLIINRGHRADEYKANIDDGNANLEILSKGNQAMFGSQTSG